MTKFPRFFIHTDKALRNDFHADALVIATGTQQQRFIGWKCIFTKTGVRHPAVNAYKTTVPFKDVIRRLGTDDVRGNRGSSPTACIKFDSYYREVTIEELQKIAASMDDRTVLCPRTPVPGIDDLLYMKYAAAFLISVGNAIKKCGYVPYYIFVRYIDDPSKRYGEILKAAMLEAGVPAKSHAPIIKHCLPKISVFP